MIGALTFLYFPQSQLFKLTSIVDSNCQPISESEYSNTSNSGDPNAIRNYYHLLFQLADAGFDLEFVLQGTDFWFTLKQLR
jgi:hypothetical protein